MAQEREWSAQYNRYPPAAMAGVSRGLNPGTPLPNLPLSNLPYNPHGFGTAGAVGGPLFPPHWPPFPRPGAFPSLSGPPPSNFSLPPIGHFPTKLPGQIQRQSMTRGPVDDDDQVQRARAEAKAAKAQQTARKTPSLDPPGKRRSRLPSKKESRKMPLSADGHPYKAPRRNSPVQPKRSNPGLRRPTRKSVLNAIFPTTSGSDSKGDLPGIADPLLSTRQDAPFSAQPQLATRAINNPPSQVLPHATAISTSKKAPRPRYDYAVPEKLRGVRIALGEDNWNEYLVLMENLYMGDITSDEFATGTKRICMFADDRIRKRMNNLMAKKVVIPHMAAMALDGGEDGREEVEMALSN